MPQVQEKVKQLIEDYIVEIENNDFKTIYMEAEENEADWDIVSEFTQVLMRAGVDPLNPKSNLDFIPKHYLDSCLTIHDIIIPAKIKKINDFAFQGCKNLHSIMFEDGSKCGWVGTKSFSESGIESIELPEGLDCVFEEAFSYCFNLKKLVLPSTIESLEYGAFDNCRYLTQLEYNGTKEKWENDIDINCFDSDEDLIESVKCSDGIVDLERNF